jgi:succinate dehydrogenase hydrophobic anchor subunit
MSTSSDEAGIFIFLIVCAIVIIICIIYFLYKVATVGFTEAKKAMGVTATPIALSAVGASTPHSTSIFGPTHY